MGMKWRTKELWYRQMIAQQLEIPLLGKIFFAVPSASTTSNYEEWVRTDLDIPADLIFTGAKAPMNAYNACTNYRNDAVLVFPGAYDVDTSTTWSKYNTHMMGLGGPNTLGDWSEPNVVLYTDNIATAQIINLTGANCQFRNLTISNYGNNAACLTAMIINKYGAYFKNVHFQGNMTTNQCTTAAAASLYIAGSGMYCVFDDCTIGQDVWGTRSGANSGQLRFTGTVQPNGIWFRDCRILSRSDTATCAAVALPANGAVGRGLTFTRCSFQNLHTSHTNLTHVFYDNDDAGQTICLQACNAMGYAQWQSKDRRIFADMPITGTGGGLCLEPTAAGGS